MRGLNSSEYQPVLQSFPSISEYAKMHSAAEDPAGPEWAKIAVQKRAQRDAAIPADWHLPPGLIFEDRLNITRAPIESGILSSREIEITETDAATLVPKLAAREYTSYEVRLIKTAIASLKRTFIC